MTKTNELDKMFLNTPDMYTRLKVLGTDCKD